VSTELEEAVRQEQNERDEASEEELHAFVRTFRLHDEIERSTLPNEIKELTDEFIDPRTDQEHWGSMPVHAQLSAFEGYIWRLREKIEVEVNREDTFPVSSQLDAAGDTAQMTPLAMWTLHFEDMLRDNSSGGHIADSGPLTEEVMFRVIARHFWHCFERRGTADMDLAYLLMGKCPPITDTGPRDSILDILCTALGYGYNGNDIYYTGVAGDPSAGMPPFDAGLEDEVEAHERKAENRAFQQGLFETTEVSLQSDDNGDLD